MGKLHEKHKKKAKGLFRSKKKKEKSTTDFFSTALLALAQPPHVDSVFIRVFIDSLNFATCSDAYNVEFISSKGRHVSMTAREIRERVLIERIRRSLRMSVDSSHPLARYNYQLQEMFLLSIPRLEALARQMQGLAGGEVLERIGEVDPRNMDKLLVLEREELTSSALAYVSKRDKPISGFKRFLSKFKLARTVYIGFLRFVVRLSLPFMRKTQEKGKKRAARVLSQQKEQHILPRIQLVPGAVAWVEYVKVYARELVFTEHKGTAELEAGLVSAVLKTSLSRQKKKEEKEAKKRKKKEKKEQKKAEKKQKKKQHQQQKGDEESLVELNSTLQTATDVSHPSARFIEEHQVSLLEEELKLKQTAQEEQEQKQEEEGGEGEGGGGGVRHSRRRAVVLLGDKDIAASSSFESISLLQSPEGEGVREGKKTSKTTKVAIVLIVLGIFAVLALAGGASVGIGVAAVTIAVSVIGTVLIVVWKIMKARQKGAFDGMGKRGEEKETSVSDAGEDTEDEFDDGGGGGEEEEE
ncbi:hypothetical protein Efla_004770 [Eimeria flavescens]